MHAFVAAGASFLFAVLWFDLMFDVQTRRQRSGALPADVLVSICAYYRRVTTEARPMNLLIPIVMLVTLINIGVEIAGGEQPAWIGWVSLALGAAAVVLAMTHTVPNARRLGGGEAPETQTRLARSVYRDHLICVGAMAALAVLQLATAP